MELSFIGPSRTGGVRTDLRHVDLGVKSCKMSDLNKEGRSDDD